MGFVRLLPTRGGAAVPGAAAAAALALATAFALTGCTSSSPTGSVSTATPTSGASVPGAAAQQQNFVGVIKRVLPSVVEIRTSSGLGSGVVFDAAGDIVTNAHVVGTATSFQVLLSSSTAPLPATLVGKYEPDDLAVIKVSGAKNLRPAVFGDSSKLQVGDIVLAIGNPLGLSSSVTDGIVSAVGRIVSEPSESGQQGATLPDAIQTSAAINPGNSGGALVGIDGRVVGIPTLAAVNQQAGGAAPGIGFAISSNTATDIAKQLVATGHVTNSHRAALGVQVTTVVGPDGTPAGAGITSVTSGGPADKAGLQAGDVITAVNGTSTPDTQTLAGVLAGLHPGQTVTVAVTHSDGTTGTVRVTLGQLPGS
ncbi:MAG: S1C family serine protease [Micromonosporaceae bacterium]